MARILIIRFSALGDVAMTIPVVHSLAVQYPQLEITVLSRAVWQPLFQGLPANVSFIGADLTGKSSVVTGSLKHFDREGIEELIRALGGKASGSVSKNTSLLVAGEKAGSKLDMAMALGVPLLRWVYARLT